MTDTKRRPLAPLAPLAAVFLLIGACQTMTPAGGTATPSVTVRDQPVRGGTVTVARVVSDGPGWLMIHAEENGGPGPMVGVARLKDGVNRNVKVTIEPAQATPVLYAMLHTDAGQVGALEFPGADAPVTVAGRIVSPSFDTTPRVSGGAMSGSSSGGY